MENYTCSITANITPKEAFEGISRVSGWWATNVKGSSNHLNDIFTVHFGETFSTFRVIEWIPENKIVWSVIDCYLDLLKNKLEWQNTKLIWEISAIDQDTQITMTHIGLVPGLECFKDCEKGWNFYITESLLPFLTKDKGLPGTGIHATIDIDDRVYKGTLFSRNESVPDFPDGYLYIDVKETNVEQVLSAYAVGKFDRAHFDPQQLKGQHYMLVEDRPLFGNLQPLEDLLQLLKEGYRCEITADVSAREAFEGICRVSDWWVTSFEGHSRQLNDIFTIHFGDTFVTFIITEVVPDREIVWQVSDSYLPWLNDRTEWTGTKLIWEISTVDHATQIILGKDRTRIHMTHVGLVPQIECYTNCIKGWDFFVKQSLLKLLTEKKGLPDTPRSARAVN